jgi:hypothetical protein
MSDKETHGRNLDATMLSLYDMDSSSKIKINLKALISILYTYLFYPKALF